MKKSNQIIKSDQIELQSTIILPSEVDRPPCLILCHPNPRTGGSMDNNVIDCVEEPLISAGIAIIKFNFRGVGESSGDFTDGREEASDVLSVVEFASRAPYINGSRLGVMGYSFGAWMALEAGLATKKIKTLVSVACPQRWYSTFGTTEIVQPKLLISGDRDHDFPLGQFRFLSNRLTDPKEIEIISGADHFFRGYESLLSELITKFVDKTI